nr:PREDICTED: esterase FE4-like [Bemisia tabaci]
MIDRELAITRTKKVANLCGCPSQPSEALLECLQKTPVDNLVESFQNFRDDFMLPLTEFAPVIEESTAQNAVLTTDPRMIKSELPWITGLNTAEHMNYSGKFLQNVENKDLNLTEQFDVFLNTWLSYGINITEEEIPAVAKKIKEFYFGAGNSINKKNIKHLDLVIADGWFLKGITDAVPFHAGPTHVYYYDYEQSDKTTFKSMIGYGVGDGKGAGHLDNILNLFPSAKRFPRRQLSPLDMQTSKNMVSLWTRFAKYGNFTSDEWEPLNKKSNNIKNLHISAAGFIQEEDLLKERANFWKFLNKNILV